jgi:hypothetical protein
MNPFRAQQSGGADRTLDLQELMKAAPGENLLSRQIARIFRGRTR